MKKAGLTVAQFNDQAYIRTWRCRHCTDADTCPGRACVRNRRRAGTEAPPPKRVKVEKEEQLAKREEQQDHVKSEQEEDSGDDTDSESSSSEEEQEVDEADQGPTFYFDTPPALPAAHHHLTPPTLSNLFNFEELNDLPPRRVRLHRPVYVELPKALNFHTRVQRTMMTGRVVQPLPRDTLLGWS